MLGVSALQMEVLLCAGQVSLPPLLAALLPSPSQTRARGGRIPRPQTPVPAACFSCLSVPGHTWGRFSHLGLKAPAGTGGFWPRPLVGCSGGEAKPRSCSRLWESRAWSRHVGLEQAFSWSLGRRTAVWVFGVVFLLWRGQNNFQRCTGSLSSPCPRLHKRLVQSLTAMSLHEGVLVEMQQEIMEKFSMK